MLCPARRRVFVAITSKVGSSFAAVIVATCASIALLSDGQTERPRRVSYVSKSDGVFQIDLKPLEAFNIDASKDWNRNSTKAERSANAPPRAWAMVLNVYKMLFSINWVLSKSALFKFSALNFPYLARGYLSGDTLRSVILFAPSAPAVQIFILAMRTFDRSQLIIEIRQRFAARCRSRDRDHSPARSVLTQPSYVYLPRHHLPRRPDVDVPQRGSGDWFV